MSELNVLIVDDCADAADTLAWLIRDQLKDRVEVVYSGEQALKVIENGFHPNVAILDINLGLGITGVDLAHKLLAVDSSIFVIGMTGEAKSEEDRYKSYDGSFYRYLIKPVNNITIMKMLKSIERTIRLDRGDKISGKNVG